MVPELVIPSSNELFSMRTNRLAAESNNPVRAFSQLHQSILPGDLI